MMTGEEILDVEFFVLDFDDIMTVRSYLKQLLKTLMDEGEGFSGKRPFGNSDWMHQLASGLVIAGVIKGSIDVWEEEGVEYQDVNDWSWKEFDTAINLAISAL